jgi:branched-chain amino acid transport system ATP-binding protein
MLELRNVHVSYGSIRALNGVSLEVQPGEVVALIGSNGAGKSTTLKTISGLLRPRQGTIQWLGQDITRLAPDRIVALGISHCPEGRRIFARLTVDENLRLGAIVRRGADSADDLAWIYQLFPVLKTRGRQAGGTLSGGEQQMLAIARALISRPRLLLLDEPSLGLAPLIVRQIFGVLADLNKREGLTVFLVEQNAYHALKLANRGYVMVNGLITMSGTGKELLEREEVRSAYLEGGR